MIQQLPDVTESNDICEVNSGVQWTPGVPPIFPHSFPANALHPSDNFISLQFPAWKLDSSFFVPPAYAITCPFRSPAALSARAREYRRVSRLTRETSFFARVDTENALRRGSMGIVWTAPRAARLARLRFSSAVELIKSSERVCTIFLRNPFIRNAASRLRARSLARLSAGRCRKKEASERGDDRKPAARHFRNPLDRERDARACTLVRSLARPLMHTVYRITMTCHSP